MISGRGVLQVILAGLLFSLMSAGVKLLSPTQPSAVIVFFRNAFALAVLLPILGRTGLGELRTAAFPLHLLRGLSGLSAMYCFFWAIGQLQLANAVLLNYTLPLFMPLIAHLWLDERISRKTLPAVVVGFLGVALIVRPTGGVVQLASIVGLAAGILGALAQVTIRRLTRTEPAYRIVLYFSLISTVVSGVFLVGFPLNLNMRELLILGGVGMSAALAQVLLTHGYASAPAALVGPFIYSTVVFAAGLDWLLWGHLPDRISLLGTILICLGGVLVMRSSRRSVPVRP